MSIRRRLTRRNGVGALGLAVTTLAVTTAACTPTQIDAGYTATGPAAVTTRTVAAPAGDIVIVHPTDLAGDGVRNPIVTWGNGSGGTCAQAGDQILDHLASWGYVTVCAETPTSGTGQEVWAATQYMIAQDTTPSSDFHQQLDTANIAAAGHSQGATGAAQATILSGGAISSTVAIALPNADLHFPPTSVPEFDQIDTPTFLLAAQSDIFAWEWYQQTYFAELAGPAYKATRAGTDHITVVEQSLGYVTAWLRYTLDDDQNARIAFVDPPPAHYLNMQRKDLP